MTRTRPLRKRFRYRDQTGAPLEDHVEHWRSFRWNAGPVIVQHKGAAWGTPQVWAESVAEGKRVIRHAGAIAGVDPDGEGEWVISAPSGGRVGQSAPMAVRRLVGGFLAITKREGSSGMPDVMR